MPTTNPDTENDRELALKTALYRAARKLDARYDACGLAIRALKRLVAAKDEKEQHGETEKYHLLKIGAWEDAREALKELGEL